MYHCVGMCVIHLYIHSHRDRHTHDCCCDVVVGDVLLLLPTMMWNQARHTSNKETHKEKVQMAIREKEKQMLVVWLNAFVCGTHTDNATHGQ